MYTEYLWYWLDLLSRRSRILLQVATAVLGVVVFATALWPPTYESTAEILVQDNRAQFLAAPNLRGDSDRDPTIVSNPVSEQDLNSELELLTSLNLIRAATKDVVPKHNNEFLTAVFDAAGTVVSLPLTGYENLHNARPLTDRDRWVLKLQAHLYPMVVKRSNVIEVRYRSHDAPWSQEFLSRLIAQYLEYHARISHDPEAKVFFEHQAQQLNGQLHASEEKLRDFELRNGITDLNGQNQALITQLSELELEYKKNGVQLTSTRQQVASLQGLLKATPKRIVNENKSVQNLALAQLKPQVLQLKAERADVLSRYQPNSLRIKEIDARLAAAQRILDHENHLEVQERTTQLNPIWVTLDTNLAAAKANAESLAAGQIDLSSQIQTTKDRLATMVNNGIELSRLQRQVQTDTEAYLTYIRKSEEARVAQGLNANRILNVSVSQPPLFPLKPVFPMLWLNLAAGFVLALGFGVFAAYREEKRDPKIYTAAAIAEVSGLSTIAVLHEQP